MKYTAALLAVLLVAGCTTRAGHRPEVRMHRTDALAEVVSAANRLAGQFGAERVLVGFDLDNSLLAMRTELGADQWYDWQKSLQAADPCHPALVANRLAAQGALYHAGAMEPTEPRVAALITGLQERGHPVMVITARGPDFRLPTFRELRRNGLSFLESAPGPHRGLETTFRPGGATRAVRYEDGVLMLAGQHKGEMLMAVYDHLGLPLPAAVVFVDDKRSNTEAMIEALQARNLDADVFVYTGQEERVARFDSEAARADWERVEPALRTIEAVMGEVNYDLPEDRRPAGCP